jgi:hypothetical protein
MAVALFYGLVPLLVVAISWVVIRRDYGRRSSRKVR